MASRLQCTLAVPCGGSSGCASLARSDDDLGPNLRRRWRRYCARTLACPIRRSVSQLELAGSGRRAPVSMKPRLKRYHLRTVVVTIVVVDKN